MTFAALRGLVYRRRSLAWLLALLLWLPVAQWAAASHALLHLAAASGTAEDTERPAHLPASCETCVVAAAIGAAAPQSAPAIAILPRPPQARPPAPVGAGLFLPFAPPYRSRAPPSLPA